MLANIGVLLLTGRAAAATLTVGPSATYATIAEAESAAVSGDTIEIGAGVWFEILDPQGKDLTYTSTAGATLSAVSPCLHVYGGETVTVRGLVFEACAPAIRLESGSLTVEDSAFTNNSCDDGCAVHAEGGGRLAITGSSFSANAASGGGGSIYASGLADVTIADTTFTGGSAGWGGEVALVGTTASLTDLTFDGAEATGAGGALWASETTLSLDAVTFSDNLAGTAGGGAWVSGAVEVTYARFVGNAAVGDGGGLYADASGGLGLFASAFLGNVSGAAGGGAWVDAPLAEIDGVAFVENAAGSVGGGLALYDGATASEVRNVAFACNTAVEDGGAHLLTDASLEVSGLLAVRNDLGGVGGANYLPLASLVWSNVGYDWDDTAWLSWEDNQNVNPRVRHIDCDADWTSEDLAPDSGSPLVDATPDTDADGTAGDIGAYGGTWGAALDVDADGWTYWDGDCHDGRADAFPGGVEVWYDGVDQDCDGRDDDQDVDGYDQAEDCDDVDAGVNPGMAEVWYDGTDQDCDGNDDDQDLDGYVRADDCDDTLATVNPSMVELWYDGVDQDCDGNDDDQDLDGHGLADDCDDLDATLSPSATEAWYDGVDQDCDGNDDDQDYDGSVFGDDCDDTDASVAPTLAEIWYDGVDQDCDGNDLDQDRDGESVFLDCDDTDATAFPGAAEVWYDGVDQDCDGNDDDQDGDGAPGGTGGTDCDDTDATVFPGAEELWYDAIDQDCDGNDFDQDLDGWPVSVDCDDEDPAISPAATETWYDGIDQDCAGDDDFDQDGDGAATLASGGTDCDDTDPAIVPGAVEAWYDGVDQDCDGNDTDQDGDGAAGDDGPDCDDLDATVFPGAVEAWYDGVDQDCDGRDDDQDGDGAVAADDCDDTDATVLRCITRIDGGCSSAGVSPGWLLALAAGLFVRRSKRRRPDEGGPQAKTNVLSKRPPPPVWDTNVLSKRPSPPVGGEGGRRPDEGGLAANPFGERAPTSRWREDGREPVAAPATALARDVPRPPGGGTPLSLRAGTPLALLLLAGPAHAIDATATGRAPTESGGLVRAGGMTAGVAGNLDVALAAGFTGTTAEATYDDGSTATLMGGVATLQVGAGWTFVDGVRVEVGLPVVLGAAVPEGLGPGLGDAWVGVQWAAVRGDAVSFGPALELAIPSGSAERLSGGGGVGGALLAAASGRAGPVRWGAEVGAGLRAEGGYEALTFTHEPEMRFGGGARITVAGPFSLGGEVVGRVGFGAENAVALATSGAEGFLTAGVALDRLDVGLAGGVGLLDGVGTPDARVVLSVRSRLLHAGPRAQDADADGVADAQDTCPAEREDDDGFQDDDGCPDPDDDADGILDGADRCPSDPEDRDYVQDADGCPDLDDDSDGLADTFDRCPREAGPAETNGCPDRDRDGMLDGADRCPDDAAIPGTDLLHNDGCPGRVVVFPDRLNLADGIHFDAGRATLRPESAALLREVAAVLQRYPDLPRVEIAVHVDDGEDAAALKLTIARAEVVRKALVAAGVAEGRLVAQGYGDARPIAPGGNERVELLIRR